MESKNLEKLKDALLTSQPYFGTVLSATTVIECKVGEFPALAGIGVHPKFKNLIMYLREDLYDLPISHQLFVLTHEIYHVVFCHVQQPPSNDMKDRMLVNMAMDMAINQEITGAPANNDYIFPEKFNLPRGLSTWEYYAALKKDPTIQPMEGFDSHEFGTLEELIEACKDTLLKADRLTETSKRTCSNKTFNEQKKALMGVSKRNSTKEILRYLCKISLQSKDVEKTYSRASRRYQDFPGNQIKESPRLLVAIDTSGSIGEELVSDALGTVLNLAKAIGATVECVLWHTEVYDSFPIKSVADVAAVQVQSGGTDITDLMGVITKKKPDLSVIITDGCFSWVEPPKSGRVVWLLNQECQGWNAPRTVKGY